MDFDFDDNPYDFKSQLQRLQHESKSKTQLPIHSKTNQQSTSQVNTQKTIPAEQIISKVNTTTKYDSQPSANTRTRHNKKNKKNIPLHSTNVIGPIICIGDFDDGYNIPQSKPLHTQNIITIDDDITTILEEKYNDDENNLAELNRIINVKVYWRKTRTYRFPIRMFQTIESIYEHFAKQENIDISHVYLELNKISLSPSDTPSSINYKIMNFIDGDIVFYKSPYETLPNAETSESKKLIDNEIKFHILQKNVKHPLIMSIKKTDKMQILYIKLSEKLSLDINSFTLYFDGEKIKNSDTIESLDLEGDECIELFKKN